MPLLLYYIFLTVWGLFTAIIGFFLKAVYSDFRELRDNDRKQDVELGRLDVRVATIERGRRA